MSIAPDPDYDFVNPYATLEKPKRKKGSQCGRCGMKFEYGQTYGYSCGFNDCPMGHGPFAFGRVVATVSSPICDTETE